MCGILVGGRCAVAEVPLPCVDLAGREVGELHVEVVHRECERGRRRVGQRSRDRNVLSAAVVTTGIRHRKAHAVSTCRGEGVRRVLFVRRRPVTEFPRPREDTFAGRLIGERHRQILNRETERRNRRGRRRGRNCHGQAEAVRSTRVRYDQLDSVCPCGGKRMRRARFGRSLSVPEIPRRGVDLAGRRVRELCGEVIDRDFEARFWRGRQRLGNRHALCRFTLYTILRGDDKAHLIRARLTIRVRRILVGAGATVAKRPVPRCQIACRTILERDAKPRRIGEVDHFKRRLHTIRHRDRARRAARWATGADHGQDNRVGAVFLVGVEYDRLVGRQRLAIAEVPVGLDVVA